jgi:hypothetical protein
MAAAHLPQPPIEPPVAWPPVPMPPVPSVPLELIELLVDGLPPPVLVVPVAPEMPMPVRLPHEATSVRHAIDAAYVRKRRRPPERCTRSG